MPLPPACTRGSAPHAVPTALRTVRRHSPIRQPAPGWRARGQGALVLGCVSVPPSTLGTTPSRMGQGGGWAHPAPKPESELSFDPPFNTGPPPPPPLGGVGVHPFDLGSSPLLSAIEGPGRRHPGTRPQGRVGVHPPLGACANVLRVHYLYIIGSGLGDPGGYERRPKGTLCAGGVDGAPPPTRSPPRNRSPHPPLFPHSLCLLFLSRPHFHCSVPHMLDPSGSFRWSTTEVLSTSTGKATHNIL